VTGGAGGIGSATADRLLSDGACVVLADIDEQLLAETSQRLTEKYGNDVVRQLVMDVTSEDDVRAAFAATTREFGGLDILVSNAGIASSALIENTTMPVHLPIAPPRLQKFIWLVAWRWKVRTVVFALMWLTLMRYCKGQKSGQVNGCNNALMPTARMSKSFRSTILNARC